MALLFLDGVGSNAEQLAIQAGKQVDIPVGYDSTEQVATFDSDSHDEAELQKVVYDALAAIDPDWGSHLTLSE